MVNHSPPQRDAPSGRLPAQARRPPDMSGDGARLTAREQELLPLIKADKTNEDIAEALGISLNTVRTHIKHIRRKLRIGHREWAHMIEPK